MINLNITIIHGMMIKSPNDSRNHRNGFGGRGPLFEVNFLSLSVLLSWWIIWFITIKVVYLAHISSKNW